MRRIRGERVGHVYDALSLELEGGVCVCVSVCLK